MITNNSGGVFWLNMPVSYMYAFMFQCLHVVLYFISLMKNILEQLEGFLSTQLVRDIYVVID